MAKQGDYADNPRSVMEHLEELRARILFSLGLTIICSGLVYVHIPRIMAALINPVGKLYFMSPAEAFWVQVKLAMIIGVYCALPFIFFQVWRFVETGLRQREKHYVVPLTFASFMLFTLGAGFCYYLVIPVAVKFLLSYGSDTLVPLISVSRYISFIGCLMFSFGAVFQLPLLLIFLAGMGLVTSRSLRAFRQFAVVGSFIVGAALTPTPDMVNQMLLALPIIILYEASIWIIMLFERRKKSNHAQDAGRRDCYGNFSG